MEPRPFRVLGLQQIALGGKSRGPLRSLWIDLFGLARVKEFKSQAENVVEDILTLGRGVSAVEIDLMEPIDPAGRPNVAEPALNHVGLWVDNLRAAVDWLEKNGVRFAPGGIRKGASGHDVCFIHPKASDDRPIGGAGVLIELVQAPLEVLEALGGNS